MQIPNHLINFTTTVTEITEIFVKGKIFTSALNDTVRFDIHFGTC